MRQVRASDAKDQFPSLLDAVERGETVVTHSGWKTSCSNRP